MNPNESQTPSTDTSATEAPIVAQTPSASKSKAKGKSKPKVKLSKCARIDELWASHYKEVGSVKGGAETILAVILKEYKDVDEESTMRTIRCRPWHMRQAGALPASTRGQKKVVKKIAKKKAKAKVESPAATTEPAIA